MIDNRIVRVNTPSIVESRTEVVTKSGTRSYSIAMMAARIAVGKFFQVCHPISTILLARICTHEHFLGMH